MKWLITSSSKKILILSCIFTIFIYFGSSIINAKTLPSEWNFREDNSSRYQDINIPILSNVWVAIATNIGTDFDNSQTPYSWKKNEWDQQTFDEILDINQMINNPDLVRKTMIQTNMLTIQEYLAYLRNDLRNDLNGSSDKSNFLNEYIQQLEIRYKTATKNLNRLLEQQTYLQWIMRDADNRIEAIKIQLDSDFKNFNDRAVIVDVENYLEQSKIKRTAYTYLVFTNKFIEQYNFLNNYNKWLLDVLILNKKAIATESYVVIPNNWWTNILRDFNLLYDESVFKEKE